MSMWAGTNQKSSKLNGRSKKNKPIVESEIKEALEKSTSVVLSNIFLSETPTYP